MSGYAVICNARHRGRAEYLGLVDRAKTKRRWWTAHDVSEMLKYRSEDAARFACQRLRHNAPQVIPFHEAAQIIGDQLAARERTS